MSGAFAIIASMSAMTFVPATASAGESVGSSCVTVSWTQICTVRVTNTDKCGLNPFNNYSIGRYSIPSACASMRTYSCSVPSHKGCGVYYTKDGRRYYKWFR